MSVDERYLARWREQGQIRDSQHRPASLALAPELAGDTAENEEFRYRGMWQLARVDQWPNDDAALSHEAYLVWWRENGGDGNDYTVAQHFENHMQVLQRVGAFRRVSVVEVFDLLLTRYGPLLAAEAFRRWLAAHADANAAGG